MVYLLTLLFFFLSILTIFDLLKSRYKNLIFIIVGLLLFIVAAFRPETTDRDHQSYLDFFEKIHSFGDSAVEPSFTLISIIVHNFLFSNSIFIFIIYAAIAVSLKFCAIKQLSDFRFASILLYFSYLFILQDMTQIRVGVATGFLLLTIKPLYERNLWKFLLFFTLAVCFHYSAIIILPFWFFNTKKINRWIYGFSIIGCYCLYFSFATFITQITNFLPSGAILNKALAYESENGGVINVFNSWQLLRCLLSFILLWKIHIIQEKNRYAILLIKLYILATALYVSLAYSPVFAGRISDFLSVVDIIIIPYLTFLIKPRFAGLFLIIAISFVYLSLNLFYNKIIL